MKYTVLQMVQKIMSSLDGPEVNSIEDNPEAMQVAHVLETVFYQISPHADLPEHNNWFSLVSSADNTKPVVMTLPDNVQTMEWLKYNKATIDDDIALFREVKFLPVAEFVDRMYNLQEDGTDTDTFTLTSGGNTLFVKYVNNVSPTYYTSFDDRTVLFDSIDLEVDTVLQSSKTMAYGSTYPAWSMSDSFVPNLDDNVFPLLLDEAKALAFAELKQTQHAKAEQTARRGWVSLQNRKYSTEKQSFLDQLPNYGRK